MADGWIKWLTVLCCWWMATGRASSSSHFNLTILHTNDIHSRFQETNVYSNRCNAQQAISGKCYGGFGRLVHQTQQIRQREPNSIYLDAGDLFQGTVWYSVHKWKVAAQFANLLNLTAMVSLWTLANFQQCAHLCFKFKSLGNHEFDDGIEGLAPFLNAVNFPLLASNIHTDSEPEMTGKLSKSIVLQIGGRNVGIIGYTYPEAQVTDKQPAIKDY